MSQLNIPAKSFASFLPTDNILQLGDIWELIPVTSGRNSQHLANNRYHPPDLNHQSEIVLFKILQMFHKNAFLYSRFPPQGVALFLRASNDEFYDILFRVHAEYQLNEVPYYPFWFTPAAFTGRMIVAKNASEHVAYFQLNVPTEKRLNVDMEWLNDMEKGESNMEVDIGYMVISECKFS